MPAMTAEARSAAAHKAVATRRARIALGFVGVLVQPKPQQPTVPRAIPNARLAIGRGKWKDGYNDVCPRDCKDCARARAFARDARKPIKFYLGPKPLPTAKGLGVFTMPPVGTLPAPPAHVMRLGIPDLAKRQWANLGKDDWIDPAKLAWDYWHAGVKNPPPFPTEERLAEQRALMEQPTNA